jgi:uncharacterized membrane protein
MELITHILTGLSAGIFFAWSVTVIPGTKTVSDKCYLETMKAINKKILNPVFFVVLFGPVLFLIMNAINLEALNVAAAISYLIGPIGITMTKNVPLNDNLDAKDLSKFSADEEKNFRLSYELNWNRWHYIRTATSVLSLILITL